MNNSKVKPDDVLNRIEKSRHIARKRRIWSKSKLIRHLAELVKLRTMGASFADLQYWLRKEKRIKIARSSILRFLKKHISTTNVE